MAAYSLSDRFPRDSKYFRILDPGAYQYDEKCKVTRAEAPFLSKTPRRTSSHLPIWTSAIYGADWRPKIKNCTSMMSKKPRFPFEAVIQETTEEKNCQCGMSKCCQCSVEEEKAKLQIICQGKVPRHILKGTPRRTFGESGLSVPSKGDCGFKINRDGSLKRLRKNISNESPQFYETRVIESTMYYRGCKWSKRASTRANVNLPQNPGPADYVLSKPPNAFQICAEKVRAKKRKESKQYRYIEMVQRRNLLDNFPGPASYTPMLPKGTDLQETISKADRFPISKYNINPSPADYSLQRILEPPDLPLNLCQAVLPQPAGFGVKAKRFRIQKEEGPSPATYCTTYKECQFHICTKAPFGSTVSRFESKSNEIANKEIENTPGHNQTDDEGACPCHTWQFKSKTVRMKPLNKIGQANQKHILPLQPSLKRSLKLQHLAPFSSSNGRFQPWFSYMAVHGRLVTPGPGYYNVELSKCYSAVNRGPLYQSRRFHPLYFLTPGPNEYEMKNGIEGILATHNMRLKNNIERQHQFRFDFPSEPKKSTADEKEDLLIKKCIAICDEMMGTQSDSIALQDISINKIRSSSNVKYKKKLLRYFLYKHKIPRAC